MIRITSMRIAGTWLLWLWLCPSLTGCDSAHDARGAAVKRVAAAFGGAECATCGMVVREQPAPRAQLVHRDGTRAFFCSIGDLVVYMASPSPHGPVDAVYVEALDPAADPSHPDKALRPWVDARTAGYVLGIERKAIMGKPVLAYASKSAAASVAKRYAGTPANFEEVQKQLVASAQR